MISILSWECATGVSDNHSSASRTMRNNLCFFIAPYYSGFALRDIAPQQPGDYYS
jgi:hypothetical protein